MRSAFILPITLITFLVLLLQDSAHGQEDLASLRTQWVELDAKMKKTFAALDSGDTSSGLSDQYKDMVDQANELIAKMREAGMASISKDAPDAETIRTLMGIMVHDVKSGRDGEALNLGDALINSNINPLWFQKAASLDRLEMVEKRVFEELVIRQKEAAEDDLPQVKIVTSKGEIILELFENEAPNTVNNFVSLVESGQYSNKLFHRVLEGFMAQTGGFEIDGVESDDPGYKIPCECSRPDFRRHFTGSLSMAHAGRDTGCRQFFITFERTDFLDKRHTVFGRVISGNEVLERIERTAIQLPNGREQPIGKVKKDKILSAEVLRKRDHVYRPRKVGEPELPLDEPKDDKPADEETEAKEDDSAAMKEAETKESEPEPKEKDPEPAKEESSTGEKEEPVAEKSGEEKEPAKEEPATEPEPEEPAPEEPPAEGESGGEKKDDPSSDLVTE